MGTKRAQAYEVGASLTFEVVGRFKIFGKGRPEFAFPPREIGLIASLADIGQHLCRNDAARALLAELIAECDRRQMGDYPTAMMLRVCLEKHEIPITWVPFEDLGIQGTFVRQDRN